MADAAGHPETVAEDVAGRIAELEEQVRALEAELASSKEAATGVRCPKCRFRMDEVNEYGITLDRCPGCQGVYFDDGEVDQLIEVIETRKNDGGGLLRRLFGR